MRNRYKIHIPETEYEKIAQRGLDIELRKKFQGMEFRDFYELVAKVTQYKELLRKESQRRKTSMGTYCQEVNSEEIVVAYLPSTSSFICPILVKKALNLWKKSQTSNTKAQYTFDVAKTKDIFDFPLKEKFITFTQDHQIPNIEELRGKVYCKYHNSWNHGTNSCWSFRNIMQYMINKGILKFLEETEVMVVDEDPFPPVASVNITATDMRVVLNEKKDERFSPNSKIRKVWIPKQYLVHQDELIVKGKVPTAREKENNGRYPYHSKQEIKKEKTLQRKECSSKRETYISKRKGLEHFKEENTSKVCCPSSCST